MSMKKHFDFSISERQLLPQPMPRLSENAMWLLEQRYFVPRYVASIGGIEKEKTFEEFARRVARTITSAETLYLSNNNEAVEWLRTLEKNITSDILNRRFLFNSPCLFSAAAGLTIIPEFAEIIYKIPDEMSFSDYKKLHDAKTKSQQLFACFVISVPDSIEGIFDSVRDAGVISKFGGGVGGNFGRLRESGSDIGGGVGGQASGPVSFMETWNTMGAVVVQGGKRRAALMGMLFDDHPDIYQFIDSKTEDGKLPYFNISVAVSDKLMKAAEDNDGFDLISRADGSVIKTVNARELMNRISESAWKRGDPGVFFIDRAQQDNILKMSKDWNIESTNPCGEQPLPNYTSCNLGSINVEAFVNDGVFDWRAFRDQTFRSMYYLDLVIDACSYPLPLIEERTKKIRPVGLGLMGLADAAILQGLVYGSHEFNMYCTELSQCLAGLALTATAQIVKNGKEPFTECELVKKLFDEYRKEHDDSTIFSDEWFKNLTERDFTIFLRAAEYDTNETLPRTLIAALWGLLSPKSRVTVPEAITVFKSLVSGQIRNSRRLSIAPTGSISMIMDTSSGIEPNFAWSWNRHITKTDGSGTEQREFWHKLLTTVERDELRNKGQISRKEFITAHEVMPQGHIEVTGIFAEVVDSGISKTVNLPNNATVEDVTRIYQECYLLGCKGITIYRDGSRTSQPIEIKKTAEKSSGVRVKERPGLVVFGKTIKESTPWGSVYITLNFDGTEPFEVFITVGKSGSELKAMTEALSRVISIGLRSGSKLEDFIDTLKGLSGKETWLFEFDDEHVARSIPDAIALLLEKLIERKDEKAGPREGGVSCPECKSPMEMISGCAYCFSCGYSPCK